MPGRSEPAIVAGPPTRDRDRWVVVWLALTALVLNGLSLRLSALARERGLIFSSLFGELATSAFVVTLVVLGILLRRRRPDHQMGWLLLAFGLIAAVSSLAWSNMLLAAAPGGDPALGRAVSWLAGAVTAPIWTYCVVALVIRFPSGRPETPAEVGILRWTAATCVGGAVALAIRPGPIAMYPVFDNPLITPPELRLPLLVVTTAVILAMLGPGLLAAAAMVARYRRASSIERLQLRWFAFGAALVVAASLAFVLLGALLFADNAVIREGTYTLLLLSLCSLPTAVAIAITRYRLYDIDTIIGRTVAYGALTAILAGLYAASVRLFNALFVAVTGEESETALVLTTLVLATTFTPIKGRLERLAARRFPPEPREPAAAGGDAGAIATGTSMTRIDELDARIEAIARRVARAVVEEGRRRPGGR